MRKTTISIIIAAALAVGVCGCGSQQTTADEMKADEVYQVALLQSLTLGDYDGLVTTGDLKTHGDIGIGTFDGVNGEMIVLDGTVYQALGDGTVVEAPDDETIPYATVNFMDDDIEADITADSLDDLRTNLNELVEENGKNQFYFIRIDGTCSNIEVRSELKQEKPYKPFDEVLATDQREYSYDAINGTIVGLYCPEYMSGINTEGWHFHFISDDRQAGGHVLGIAALEGELKMDKISGFEMCCPDTDEFNLLDLAQDQSERIQSVEQK